MTNTAAAGEKKQIRNAIVATFCAGTLLTGVIIIAELTLESRQHVPLFIIPACLFFMISAALLLRRLIKSQNGLEIKNSQLILTEEALQTEKKFIDHALDSLVDIFFTLDLEGRIVRYNRVLLTKTGYTKEEVSGVYATVFFESTTAHQILEAIRTVRNSGEASFKADLVSRDGTKTPYEIRGSLTRDLDGIPVGFCGVGIDQTRINTLTEQLIQSQKVESMGQLAGGLAHDLNNILTVINGYAVLLQHEISHEEKYSRYPDQILAASSRADKLTRDLLSYGRKQTIIQKNHNLNTLLEKFDGFIARVLIENITFNLAQSSDPLHVYVDSNQMLQVMTNLATNACDAMPGGGTFSISTRSGNINEEYIGGRAHGRVGRYAIITVTDTGCGMDEHIRQRIFDPFYTTKEVGKGTGLGLAMVNGIIAQHDGCVEVDSAPGVGTTFRLYLPLVDADAIIATQTTAAPTAPAVKKSGTIMIVEDDQLTRTILDELLTRTGYTVIAASDGQDAVGKFADRNDDIRLVISDVVMPRKSGITACDEIRNMCDATKFIFISGHADTVIEREGELIDGAELVMKPIIPDQLLGKIDAILQNFEIPPTVRIP